ncbi:MAG: Ig-like domain-containing protein [Pseudomonadota bacterium]
MYNTHISKSRLSLLLLIGISTVPGCSWVDSSGRQGNEAPVARVENFSTFEQQIGIILDASASDDSDGEIESFQWSVISGNENAALTLYPSNSSTAVIDTNTLFETATVKMSVTIVDNDGGTATHPFDVTITAINEPPLPTTDFYTLDEGGSLSVSAAVFDDNGDVIPGESGLLANDSDDFDITNEPLSVRIKPGAGPQYGTVSIDNDGAFTYEHFGAEVTHDGFAYLLTDGTHEVEGYADITLAPINDPPTAFDSCNETAGNPITVSGALADYVSDPDSNDLEYVIIDGPQFGNLNVDLDSGEFVYTPNTAERGYRDTFSFQVSDAETSSAQRTVELIVGTRRIMPLGGSITTGVEYIQFVFPFYFPAQGFRTGYRGHLQDILSANDFAVDFVGSRSDGSAAGISDPDHESAAGQRMFQIQANVATWLSNNPADIVLLHAGDYDFATNAIEVNSILSAINDWSNNANHDVKVLLARIIDHHPNSPYTDNVEFFNAAIDTLLSNSWPDVISVDQYGALNNVQDMSPMQTDFTGLHPSNKGYLKMAQTWYDAMASATLLHRCQP